MTDDTPRHAATIPDSEYSLSIDESLERYARAGHPRTPRSVQRYCAKGHLQCRLVETSFGQKYLIDAQSLDRHIAYINEVTPAIGRDKSGHVATGRVLEGNIEEAPRQAATGDDVSRPVATDTSDLSRYVARLEGENGFLRGQMEVKDSQIKDLTERARETNHLIAGLQKMLSPLLSAAPEHREESGDGPGER